MEWLLDEGADVNMPDKDALTVMHVAAIFLQKVILSRLKSCWPQVKTRILSIRYVIRQWTLQEMAMITLGVGGQMV